MTDPRDLLDQDMDSIPDVFPYPEGEYKGTVISYDNVPSQFDKSKMQRLIKVRLTEPYKSVDMSEFARAKEGMSLADREFNFYFDLSSIQGVDRLKKFMKSCGFKGSINENTPNLPNTEIVGTLDKKLSEKREEWYNPATLSALRGFAGE